MACGTLTGSLYMAWHGMGGYCAKVNLMTKVTSNNEKIILRQSWLGQLAMCPERARQDMLGISESTESSNTAIGTSVHYGIEQCLIEKMETGTPLPKSETISASLEEWARKESEIVRWNHVSYTHLKLTKNREV